jgi:hypothetical protein
LPLRIAGSFVADLITACGEVLQTRLEHWLRLQTPGDVFGKLREDFPVSRANLLVTQGRGFTADR